MAIVQTHVRLDRDLIVKYKIAAAKKGLPMAALIRKALEKGLKEYEK